MSIPHDAFQDDLAAFALGALDDEATARLKQHLSTCAECRERLHEYEEITRLLPLGLPRTEPSPTSRRELLARVRRVEKAERQGNTRGWWPKMRRHLLTAAAVVAIVFAAAIYWESTNDNGIDAAETVAMLRDDADTEIVSMRGSPDAPQAVAQLFFQPGRTRAGLVVSGLPPLPDHMQYQLWFVDPDDTRYDGGMFDVDDSGQAMVVINAPADYSYGWRCGVTEEPAGGSDVPTGRNVLIGSYEEYEW